MKEIVGKRQREEREKERNIFFIKEERENKSRE